jgi:3-deoxy-manno-octulosonate cytidylyltransferase (CMP-KDO synthetase)
LLLTFSTINADIKDEIEINNPNNVKVVVDQNGMALYFSRSVIPYPREQNVGVRYFQHIGIYAFRKQALIDFYHLPMKSLEASEKLEQLRYLEFGKRIKMVETTHVSIGIDTPEDLERAKKIL